MAGEDGDYTGTPSDSFSLDGLFKSVSPYLDSFTSGASSGFVGYILGDRRDTPGLAYTGNPRVASASSGLSGMFPWLAVLAVVFVGVMFLGGRR